MSIFIAELVGSRNGGNEGDKGGGEVLLLQMLNESTGCRGGVLIPLVFLVVLIGLKIVQEGILKVTGWRGFVGVFSPIKILDLGSLCFVMNVTKPPCE